MDDVRTTLAFEIVSEMSDEQFMQFTKAEQTRRNNTVKSLDYEQRVRFPMTTRPKRLAGATGLIVDMKYYGGKWSYKVKMDHHLGMGETFIRIERTQIEVIDPETPVKYAGPRQGKSRQNAY
jgi:hypothetical protein